MRTALALLVIALGCWAIAADPPPAPPGGPASAQARSDAAPPSTPAQAADAVLAAVKEKDGARLGAIAAKDDPDPWLVADELVARGELDAALAFARAAPRVDVEKLPEYVTSRRGKADDPTRRDRLARANAALTAKQSKEALDALGAPESDPPSDVVGVRLAMGRGLARNALEAPKDAVAAFVAAGEGAERIGWLSRAANAYERAAVDAFSSTDRQPGDEHIERALSVARRLGGTPRMVRLLDVKAGFQWSAGDPRAAIATREEAYALAERAGDLASAAWMAWKVVSGWNDVDPNAGAGLGPRAIAAARRLGDSGVLASALLAVASAHQATGAFREALDEETEGLALCRAKGDRMMEALLLGNASNAHRELGEYSLATERGERALEMFREFGDRTAVSRTLTSLAAARYWTGDFAGARARAEEARALAKEAGARGDEASALCALADASQGAGSFRDALAFQTEALRIYEEVGARAQRALTLGNIANAHLGLGEYALAVERGDRALAIFREMGAPAGQCRALAVLSHVHYFEGDFARARALAEEALALAKSVDAKRDEADALCAIANAVQGMGSYRMALEHEAEALRIYEKIGARGQAALTLGNMANSHLALGEYALATERNERALKIMREVGDLAGQGRTLRGIAGVQYFLGEFDGARASAEEALALSRTVGAKSDEGDALGAIADALHGAGAYRLALERETEALGVHEATGATARQALTLGNMGNAYLELGEFALATDRFERALEIDREIGDRGGAAYVLESLAFSHRSAGDLAGARAFGEQALAAASEVGSRWVEASAEGELAHVALEAGDAREALAHARASQRVAATMAAGLADGQEAVLRGHFTFALEIGSRAAARLGDPIALTEFLEQGRAGALLDALRSRAALREFAIPEALRVAEAEGRAREAAAVTAYRGALDAGRLPAIAAARRAVVSAQEAVREVVERIQREAKKGAGLVYPRADELGTIRARLRKDEALVVYGLFSEDPLALVVTTAGARIVALPATAHVDAACAALLSEMDERTSPDAATALAGALGRLVVAPLGLDGSVTRVLIAPDAAVSYVPFSILLPGREVAYVPSGTTYGVLLADGEARGESVLALGDPDYGAKVGERALAVNRGAFGRLTPLPATADEAKAVGQTVLLGSAATEAGLAAAIGTRPRWRAVHLACHGLIDAQRPFLSSLALTADDQDDGFLTALEIFQMRIPADLVVLSACETGKGKLVRGEGIMGLTRAFMFAGAPRVICSLWKVDDDATRALMTRFYELWNPKDGKPGLSTAEALAKAQEFVRSQEKWKHPYYWAAWVLWGLPS